MKNKLLFLILFVSISCSVVKTSHEKENLENILCDYLKEYSEINKQFNAEKFFIYVELKEEKDIYEYKIAAINFDWDFDKDKYQWYSYKDYVIQLNCRNQSLLSKLDFLDPLNKTVPNPGIFMNVQFYHCRVLFNSKWEIIKQSFSPTPSHEQKKKTR